MAPGWVDVRSGASGYSRHWLYVEMACSVNVIIFRRNGQTLFDHLIHVFPVRLGIKGHSSPAVHVIFRDYGGHKRYNAENYEKLSSMTRAVAPGLLIFAKSLITLGSFLMFSGLWLK